MIRRRALSFALVGALTFGACAPAVQSGPGTPAAAVVAGSTLQKADAVLQRVGELQATVIQANQDGAISDHDAVVIVRFTVSTAKVIRDIPNGWEPLVATSYREVKRQTPVSFRTRFAAIFSLLDALLGV